MYVPKVYRDDGGDRQVIADGGSMAVQSGGAIDIESGGSLKFAGTALTPTAAEVNILHGATVTTDEINLLDLSAVGALVKIKKIHVTASDGTEQDSTFDLPAHAIVLDAFVNVTTAESTGTTKTLDVGLLSSESGGDADGFLDGVSTAATGLVRGALSITKTVGTNETYISAVANTFGALLQEVVYELGTDTAGDTGFCTVTGKKHLSDSVTAKSVSYTAGSAQTEFVGDIFIVYIELA